MNFIYYFRLRYLLFVCCCFPQFLMAQFRASVSSEMQAGTGHQNPYFFTVNRHGLASSELQNGFLRASLFKDLSNNRKWDLGFSADLLSLYNYPGYSVRLQQLAIDIKYRYWLLSMGSKEYGSILKNNQLSSGGLVWSGNARPIPQIRLGFPDFVSFPWLFNGHLKVRGNVAYGWFTDGDYQKKNVTLTGSFYNQGVLYQQKEFLMKYDLPHMPWSFVAGLETETQFGGSQYTLLPDGTVSRMVTPAKLKHYLMAFFPMPGDDSSIEGDQHYVYGNALGSLHFVATYSPSDFELKAYLENPFEDFSGMSKQNGFDGLWGLEYASKGKSAGITGVVLEYLQTTNQGGPIHWAPNDYAQTNLNHQATGADEYYNNVFYTGWQHWGLTSGTPLITSPIYNPNGELRMFNNRVKAIHLGVAAAFNNRWSGRLLTHAAKGWGTPHVPLTQVSENISILCELNYFLVKRIGIWQISSSLAIDKGNQFGDNIAFSIGVRKNLK